MTSGRTPPYRIRIGGELLEMLQEAAEAHDLSSSEIIGKAIRLAEKQKQIVVVAKKTKNDHKKGDYDEPIKIYGIGHGKYNSETVRSWLRSYLEERREQTKLRMQEKIFLLEHTVNQEQARAAIMQDVFAESFDDRVEYWRRRREGSQSEPGGLGMREAQEQTPKA